MIIYSEVTSKRLKYLVGFLSSFYQNEVRLTATLPTDTSVYINYSKTAQPNSIQINPHNLLFEDNIKPQKISIDHWKSVPIFFKTSENNVLEFDILAASFYMISRYEEYLPYLPDAHQRFPASESMAFKSDFLDIPVVDEWLLLLAEQYNHAGGNFRIKRTYSFVPTIDIDKAYAYKHQAFPYNVLIPVKSLFTGNFKECVHVIGGKEPDPFDVYNMLDKQHKKYNVNALFFILCGERGIHDKNIPIKSKVMYALVSRLVQENKIGIHPSYASFENPKKITLEQNTLSKVAKIEINKSRQHYLRFTLPHTFHILERLGIKEEYSMGFADQPGFRAGTCSPFNFYNLKAEQETSIKIFPLILMDVTLSHYLHLNKEEAINHCKKFIERVKKVNGCFISLWHNSSFSSLNNMDGWDVVYKEMMKYAASND